MTLIQREIWVVRVTELSRDKFIHSYANKKKKETAHLTGAGKKLWVFESQGQRANEVSSFDTNMKRQKNCLF